MTVRWLPSFVVAALLIMCGAAQATMPTLTPLPKHRAYPTCSAWASKQDDEAREIWGIEESGSNSGELALARLTDYCLGKPTPEIVGFGTSAGYEQEYCSRHTDQKICKAILRKDDSAAGATSAGTGEPAVAAAEDADTKKIRESAEHGDARAMAQLGAAYYTGNGEPEDKSEALYWIKKAAEANDPLAMNNMGAFYEDGSLGLTKDDVAARHWYEKAAGLGEAQAMKNLGGMYEEGRGGLTVDESAAFRWFKRGADAGNPRSMTRVAMLLREGKGTSQDAMQAYAWAKKAAENGDAMSMDMLGAMAMTGEGTSKDEQAGFGWFLRGADAGDVASMDDLGQAYLNGVGTAKNIEKAVEWFHKAADGGAPRSQFMLGLFFETKNGPGDKREAISWYRKSDDQGFKPAHDALARLHVQ